MLKNLLLVSFAGTWFFLAAISADGFKEAPDKREWNQIAWILLLSAVATFLMLEIFPISR